MAYTDVGLQLSYERIGYNPYIMRQTACLAVNPITVDSCYILLFKCTTVVRASNSSGLGLDALSLAWPAVVQLVVFFNSGSQWVGLAKSTCLCFIIVINLILCLRNGA